MAILSVPADVQKMEFNVTTAEGPSRMTIMTGQMPISLTASKSTQSASFKALLDPPLAPGQFRKAVAMVSFSNTHLAASGTSFAATWQIDDVQATLDDETGKVQLLVDLTVQSSSAATAEALVMGLWFQVTTLAVVLAA